MSEEDPIRDLKEALIETINSWGFKGFVLRMLAALAIVDLLVVVIPWALNR